MASTLRLNHLCVIYFVNLASKRNGKGKTNLLHSSSSSFNNCILIFSQAAFLVPTKILVTFSMNFWIFSRVIGIIDILWMKIDKKNCQQCWCELVMVNQSKEAHKITPLSGNKGPQNQTCTSNNLLFWKKNADILSFSTFFVQVLSHLSKIAEKVTAGWLKSISSGSGFIPHSHRVGQCEEKTYPGIIFLRVRLETELDLQF